MRDLEIRGDGNMLGAAQSGQIHAVGMELYGQLLQEAVNELMLSEGGEVDLTSDTPQLPRIDLPLAASIPDDYVEHMPTRMAIYQKLAKVSSQDQVSEISEELKDRFGTLPEKTQNLLTLTRIRSVAFNVGAESVSYRSNTVTLNFKNAVGSARAPLQRALGPSVKVGNQQLQVSVKGSDEEAVTRFSLILDRLQVFLKTLNSMAAQE